MCRYLCVCSDRRQCGCRSTYSTTCSVFWQEQGCRKRCLLLTCCTHCSGSTPSVSTTFSSSASVSASLVPALGEQVTQSMPAGSECVPLVSMHTDMPVLWSAANKASSTCNAGSPPVRTISGLLAPSNKDSEQVFTAAAISTALISRYAEKSVSQNGHRRLQPLNRTNTAGIPLWYPSPCKE